MSDEARREQIAGIFYIAAGLAFAGIAATYPLGTVARIGPGYFPLGLGLLLAVIGVVTALGGRKGRVSEVRDEAGRLKTAGVIIAGVVAFGLLIRPGGLLVAVVVMVFIASLAEGWRPVRALLLGVALAALAWAIFLWGLGLPIRPLPAFPG